MGRGGEEGGCRGDGGEEEGGHGRETVAKFISKLKKENEMLRGIFFYFIFFGVFALPGRGCRRERRARSE
jgi:hypothetical protein